MGVFNRLKHVFIRGDYVGGDQITNLPSPTQLILLQEEYEEELKRNQTCSDLIDELNHYNSKKSEIRELGEKLASSGYAFLIKEGQELKELVAKMIIKHQHYKSAQKIIVYLLSDVHSIFQFTIKPQVLSQITQEELLKIIHIEIEEKLSAKLGVNSLEIYNRQLRGMVFFLTGNCHLEWEK